MSAGVVGTLSEVWSRGARCGAWGCRFVVGVWRSLLTLLYPLGYVDSTSRVDDLGWEHG